MKWQRYKIVHGGIVHHSKILEAAQASSSGELAKSLHTLAQNEEEC